LGSQSLIEAIIDQLKTLSYTFSYKQDGDGHLTHIFFAHPKSLALLSEYPEVLLLDCTYKSNKYKLPLLNFVGSTSIPTTFFVAFCFLKQEKEEDYIWALEQFKAVMPDGGDPKPGTIVTDRDIALVNSVRHVFPQARTLLCSWHIQQCVRGKACKYLPGDDNRTIREEFLYAWKALVQSKTPVDFNREWDRLQNKYRSYSELMACVKTVWIDPYKYKFIQCWADEALHLGHRVTSRVEGAHSLLKGYLQVATGDLKMVLDNIERLLISQHTELEAALGAAKLRPGHDLQIPLFSDVLGRVAPNALRKILEQSQILESPRFNH
jgi:hypothetical protein